MRRHFYFRFLLGLAGISPLMTAWCVSTYAADQLGQVRIVEENGVRIQETTTITRKPVAEVRVEKQAVTSYRPETVTRLRQQAQVVQVPVKAQQVVTQHYWWNPFRWGHPEQRIEATTVWQPRVQYARIPTTTQVLIPETKTVDVATRYLRFEEDKQVSRIVLGPASGNLTPTAELANRPMPPSGVVPPPGSSDPGEWQRSPSPPVNLTPTYQR